MSHHVTSFVFICDVYSLSIDFYDTICSIKFWCVFWRFAFPNFSSSCGQVASLQVLRPSGELDPLASPKLPGIEWYKTCQVGRFLQAFCWSKVDKPKSGQPKEPRPYVQQLRCHCRRPCGVQVQISRWEVFRIPMNSLKTKMFKKVLFMFSCSYTYKHKTYIYIHIYTYIYYNIIYIYMYIAYGIHQLY